MLTLVQWHIVQVSETTEVERDIHRLRVDLLRLNTLRHREHDNKTNLDRDNQLLENQFMAELKVRCDIQTDRQTDSRAMRYTLASCLRTSSWPN